VPYPTVSTSGEIHFRRKPGRDLTPPQRKANRARTAVRSAVETVFAAQKHGFRLVIRRAPHKGRGRRSCQPREGLVRRPALENG
jgi:hypothetical protein